MGELASKLHIERVHNPEPVTPMKTVHVTQHVLAEKPTSSRRELICLESGGCHQL